MGAPFNPDTVAHGSADCLREFIHDALAGVVVHAKAGMGFAEIGADALLAMSIRNATACLQATLSVAGDLAEFNIELSRQREAEDA